MTSPASTIPKFLAAIHQLSEADRVRVLQFTLAILQDRAGKRQQRRSRFQSQPVDDNWRIGR